MGIGLGLSIFMVSGLILGIVFVQAYGLIQYIKKMDISSECKDFLAILIFNESNIEERKNLLNIWNYNDVNSN